MAKLLDFLPKALNKVLFYSNNYLNGVKWFLIKLSCFLSKSPGVASKYKWDVRGILMKKKSTIVLLNLLMLLIVHTVAVAENDDMKDTITAFIVASVEASSINPKTGYSLWFDLSDESLKELLMTQGIDIKLPKSLINGYTRYQGISLRHTVNSRITDSQMKLIRFIEETEPRIVDNKDGTAIWYYDVPIQLLDDLTYVGLLFFNDTEQEVIMIIHIGNVLDVDEKASSGLRAISANIHEMDYIPVQLDNDMIAFSIKRSIDDRQPTTFLIVLTTEAADIIKSATQQDEIIVTYEFSSSFNDIKTLQGFANELR